MTIKFMADMTFMIKSKRFMTLSMVLYEAFLLPIMTGRFPMGHWGIRCLNLSMTNAMPSFIWLSRLGGLTRHFHHHANLKPTKKDSAIFFFNPSQPKHPFFPLPITGDP